jgi:hypothetical protein
VYLSEQPSEPVAKDVGETTAAVVILASIAEQRSALAQHGRAKIKPRTRAAVATEAKVPERKLSTERLLTSAGSGFAR